MIGLACALPLLAGAVLLGGGTELSHRRATHAGIGVSLVTLLLVAFAWGSGAVVNIPWLPALDLRIHLELDGISGPLAVLATVVTTAALLTTLGDRPRGGSEATFVGSVLLALAGALATFAARDALFFVVAFEFVLIPMWVLITRFGDDGDAGNPAARREAGARFVLYTGFGSTLMLLGVLLLVARAGTGDLAALAAARGDGLGLGVQIVIAVLLTLGLAVKVPVWPLHSWLPLAHTTAPTAGSMLLAAVLLKMGTYGLVRLPLATVPDGFAKVAPVLAVCGVVGIIWGGLVCLVERDLKRLIAWSSIAHMGFVVLALATGTDTGLTAALYGNLAHGVISALLFLVVGGLKHQWGGDDLGVARPALREHAPVTGLLLLTGLAAALGLPGLAGFWGEFTAIIAAFDPAADRPGGLFAACAVVAAIGAALAAGYALRVARLVWLGERHAALSEVSSGHDETSPAESPRTSRDELPRTDLVAGGLLALIVLVLGVAPGLVLAVTDPALASVVTR